jgi:peroxiredoxin
MQNGHRASPTCHSPRNAQRDDTDDHKRQFGQEYGVLIKEWRLLQRAVVVIDANDRVIHIEYVADQMHEPDYEPAIDAINRAVHTTS